MKKTMEPQNESTVHIPVHKCDLKLHAPQWSSESGACMCVFGGGGRRGARKRKFSFQFDST